MENDEVMTFDEILSDKVYQSEFDKRVTKALETAKMKWDTDANATAESAESAILDSLGIKSKDDIPELVKRLNLKPSESDDYKKLLERMEALENTNKEAQAALAERKQAEHLRGLKIPDEQIDYYQFKIGKLVTDDLSFEEAAAQFIKDNPPQIKPPEFATGNGKAMPLSTEKEQILKAAQSAMGIKSKG